MLRVIFIVNLAIDKILLKFKLNVTPVKLTY